FLSPRVLGSSTMTTATIREPHMTTATSSELQRQVKQFHKDGYLVVPGVLSQEQVSWLRSFLRSKFDTPPGQPIAENGDRPYLLDIWSSYPEARWLLFHEPVLRLLKALLGDYLGRNRPPATRLAGIPRPQPILAKDTICVSHTRYGMSDIGPSRR